MLSTDQVVVCLLPLAKLLLLLPLFLACFQRRCCCAFKVSFASKFVSVHSRSVCVCVSLSLIFAFVFVCARRTYPLFCSLSLLSL